MSFQGTPGNLGPEGLAGEPGQPGPPGAGKPGPPVRLCDYLFFYDEVISVGQGWTCSLVFTCCPLQKHGNTAGKV